MLELLLDILLATRRRIMLRFDSVDRQLDEIRALLDPTAAANEQVEAMIAAEIARKERLDSLQQH